SSWMALSALAAALWSPGSDQAGRNVNSVPKRAGLIVVFSGIHFTVWPPVAVYSPGRTEAIKASGQLSRLSLRDPPRRPPDRQRSGLPEDERAARSRWIRDPPPSSD